MNRLQERIPLRRHPLEREVIHRSHRVCGRRNSPYRLRRRSAWHSPSHDADAVVRLANRPIQGIGVVSWPDLLSKVETGMRREADDVMNGGLSVW